MQLCGFPIGLDRPFFLIAGPCVIESEQLQMDVAGQLKDITAGLGIPFIFKSSFDKANRSSGTTFRGPGREKGLEILESRIDELIKIVNRLTQNNRSLLTKQERLIAERADLIDKTDMARIRVESMITRLKSMETNL